MIENSIIFLKIESRENSTYSFWLAIKLIEQLVVLSIHLSRHNILSTYDGDHIR